MLAVYKHELANYWHNLTTYLFIGFFLIFVGIGALLYNIESAVANFEYVLSFVCIGMVVIVPVLTMRSIAEERKQKTDQLLYSLPLNTSDIVIGKYLAIVTIFAIPMAVISFYPLIFAQFGEVYLLTSYGSLVAFFLMNCAMIAIGLFISSLTDNQGLAAGISIVILLFNYFSLSLSEYVSQTTIGSLIGCMVLVLAAGLIIEYVTKNENLAFIICIASLLMLAGGYVIDESIYENLLPNLMSNLSLFARFYDFVDGVFDLKHIVFYGSVIIFFLYLCAQSLDKRRYN